MTVLGSGNVGIGTTSPGYVLDVNGNININGGINMPSDLAIGSSATATGDVTVAVGKDASATAFGGVTIGFLSSAAVYGTALGYNAIAAGRAIAIGRGARGSHEYSIGLGYGATTTATNQLMIGSNSVPLDVVTHGNVGIGTTSPTATLAVSGSFSISATSNTSTSTPFQIIDSDANAKVTVLGSGNVGIGTTSPTALLHVNGNANINGTIHPVSDLRLKKNIQELPGGILSKLLKLRGISYQWKDPENRDTDTHFGVIAQEVEPLFPELVRTDEEGWKSVNYNGFAASLIEAIKEQQQMIEAQQEETTVLKASYEQEMTSMQAKHEQAIAAMQAQHAQEMTEQQKRMEVQQQEMTTLKAMMQQMSTQMATVMETVKVLKAATAPSHQSARPQTAALVQ